MIGPNKSKTNKLFVENDPPTIVFTVGRVEADTKHYLLRAGLTRIHPLTTIDLRHTLALLLTLWLAMSLPGQIALQKAGDLPSCPGVLLLY